MNLPIEKWATETNLPHEALGALREASVCYRAGAYRAALLFSYVTWGLVLRSRILRAKCPPGYPDAKWTTLQDSMSNEDKWDVAVFDATQTQKPATIFSVSDDLRAQVRYWKDRRNDCAHSKNNSIAAPHVEALWEHLRSNLDKFQVGGSVEDLVERIRDHFDLNITPPGAPCDELARTITTAVPAKERLAFFDSVSAVFRSKIGTRDFWNAKAPPFFEAVIRVTPEHVVADAAQFLRGHIDALALVLLAHPHLSHVLRGAPDSVRMLWRTKLSTRGSESTALYASILRMGLIPSGEREEAHQHMIDQAFLPPPDPQDFDTLCQSGYFTAFKSLAINERKLDNFDWGNSNAAMMAFYVGTFPLDDESARALSSIFSSPYHPRSARDRLRELFVGRQEKREELAKAIARLGISWPEPLLGPQAPAPAG
ncbi:MAG: hypothetical protein IT456_24005 [Planctomycetes bacterium]|nr:hypothetical protein [Planctomycetota bacterium]